MLVTVLKHFNGKYIVTVEQKSRLSEWVWASGGKRLVASWGVYVA